MISCTAKIERLKYTQLASTTDSVSKGFWTPELRAKKMQGGGAVFGFISFALGFQRAVNASLSGVSN